MTPPVVIDTNVVVAGLLTGNPDSPVARILDGMLAGAFPFVLSEALLAEYHAVLARSRLRKLHGLTIDEVDRLLVAIARNAILLKAADDPLSPRTPDSDDQFLWNLLSTRHDLNLVTGDRQLLEDSGMVGRVLAPATFVRGFAHSRRTP